MKTSAYFAPLRLISLAAIKGAMTVVLRKLCEFTLEVMKKVSLIVEQKCFSLKKVILKSLEDLR